MLADSEVLATLPRRELRAGYAEVVKYGLINDPDFFAWLAGLARHHLVERSKEEVGLCAEIMAESRRNPDVARIYQAVEDDVKGRLVAMLRGAAERGEISPDSDFDGAATVLMALADGLSWRRAVDPAFDAESVLPLILHMVKCLLTAPTPASSGEHAR